MVAELFLSYLEISISASLVIVLLMALTPFLNKRYATKWKCWIWVFIALRLLIPYSGTDGASVVDVLSRAKAQIAMEKGKDPADNLSEHAAAPRRVIIAVPAQMTVPIIAQSEKMSGGITLLDMAACVWLIGSLVFLCIHLVSYLRWKRQVAKCGKIIKDSRILSQVFGLKRELHIKGTVRVIQYAEAASPMLIGFLQPVLVLPEEEYSPEELFFILKHELVHLKRKDVYVKLLFVMANAVHWFNPFVRIMQKEAAIDMELSCDERVTQGADYAMRKAYTETLLSAFHKQCAKKSYLSTQFYGGKQIMKKRFKNIFRKTRRKNGIVWLIFAAVLTLTLGTLVGCSVGRGSAEELSGQNGHSGQPKEADEDIVESGMSAEDMVGLGMSGEDEAGSGISDEAGAESSAAGVAGSGEAAGAADSGGEAVAEPTMMLTFLKEGEPEEKQALLVTGSGYSLYLPEGEWQAADGDMWRTVINENVRLWVVHFAEGGQAEPLLADNGYVREDDELVKQENGILYKGRLYEDGSAAWCVFYCYPVEAEEGWGRELPVIADTFAVTVP